jgi:hypothetical protein
VQTNKNSYETAEIVIQIFSPTGATVRVDLTNVTADGRFSDSFPASGTINYAGEYRIVATYRGQYQGENTFLFEGQTIRDYACALSACTYELNIANETYPINYRITGVLNNITADTEKRSLKIDVKTESKSSVLLIALPMNVIDSVQGADKNTNDSSTARIAYTVLVDGQPGRQSEQGDTATATQTLRVEDPESVRVLAIDFTRESKHIEIVGTWIVPEFNSGVMPIILVGAVSGIIIGVNALNAKVNRE